MNPGTLPDKSLILLRGLPGSGKSTLAALLSEGGLYPVTSIDSYFTDAEGNYVFDYKQNHLAYKQCEAQTRAHLEAGTRKVFVDNTFTIAWELEPYFALAHDFGYALFVITVENHHGSKNIHDIGDEQLQKMAEKYKVKLL